MQGGELDRMVSYAKKIQDKVGCVHSIDNLVVEYMVKSFSGSLVIDSLAAEVFAPVLPGWEKKKCSKVDMPPSSAYSWFRSAIWGGGFHVQFGQYKDFDRVTREWSEYPLMRVKFNPNKHWDSPVRKRLEDWLDRMCDSGVIVKFDYAVDIPARLRDVVVRSRKEPGLHKGTRYYGQRNKHGRLKVYDKGEEGELDEGEELTRCEWTFTYGKPIAFDDVRWLTCGPEPLPDVSVLGSQLYAYAKLVLMVGSLGGDVHEALGHLDGRTQKKLEPYTIGSGVQLLDSCQEKLRDLLGWYCDALSVAFRSGGVNEISVGGQWIRLSEDDLEHDEMPF